MKIKWIITAALLTAVSITVQATEGIKLIGIGPVQQGTAGAGVASAKDSTWLILNPAGLTDVPRSVDTSLQYFAPVRTINSTANPGSGTQKDSSAFVIPSISASLGCCRKDSGHLGIGLYGTSGMGVDYAKPRFGFSAGDTRTELSIAKLTLTYAEKFDNGLSIGAGPILVLSRFRTDMETSRTATSIPADGSWDGAVGIGFIAGVNKQLNDKLTIGGSYMSEQFMTEFKEYNNLLAGSLNLPQQLTVGLAYNVRTNVEVVLDYRWIGWSHLDTLGGQFGWEDQNIVKAGVTWKATDRLTLRSGISHGNSPIDSDAGFANSLFPAIMETHLACGASYQFEKFRLDMAYIHALDATVTDSGNGTDMSMYQNSLTLGAGWTF